MHIRFRSIDPARGMRARTLLAVVALGACAACATTSGASRARATLEPRSGSAATGSVVFRERGGVLHARVDLSGLAPGSEHGFHVHEKGDCSAPDATSAGPHYNPSAQPHGNPAGSAHHAGDLMNVRANAQGRVRTDLTLAGLSLNGANSIVGRAVVLHRDPDDYTSQPAGNSGPRIACGVIGVK